MEVEGTIPITYTGTYPYYSIVSWYDDNGDTGVDTFYYTDDDNDVYTPCTRYIDLYPATNTYYTLNFGGVRCGEYGFDAPVSYLEALLEKGLLVDQQSVGTCLLHNQNYMTHFFDPQTKRPIVSIQDQLNGDSGSLGLVEVKAYFDPTVLRWNGIPYLQRHWLLKPTKQGSGKVRLYFTSTELNALVANYYGPARPSGNFGIASTEV